MSEELGELAVKECTAEKFQDRDLAFSRLDSDVAGEIGSWPRSLQSPQGAYNLCLNWNF
jgi:hypothetical protein